MAISSPKSGGSLLSNPKTKTSAPACRCCSETLKIIANQLVRTIQTYGNQGVAKTGTTKRFHSIIHTTSKPPEPGRDELPQQGEKPMLAPIRVDAGRQSDIMHHKSRLNYIKVYTVEHNVPVYDFGVVHKEYLPVLKKQFDRAWHDSDDDEDDEDDSDDDDDDDNSSDDEEEDEETQRRRIKEQERRRSEKRPSSSKGKGRSSSTKDDGKSKGGILGFGKSSRKRRK
jgi:hypothetical protein